MKSIDFDAPPKPNEIISRYIFSQSKKFNCETRQIHWKHFEPLYNDNSVQFEVSVMRVSLLESDEQKEIGFSFVGKLRGRNPIGCISFSSLAVSDVALNIKPDTCPHPLHANILGWGTKKEDALEKAKLLAKRVSHKESVFCKY